MTEIDQIAQEMDDSDKQGISDWIARLRSLSASHRLLSLRDIEQALEKADRAAYYKVMAKGEKAAALKAEARTLLGLPSQKEA